MKVDQSGFEGAMTEIGRDLTDMRAAFEKVRGEAVT